jgi:hypothetical protein
MGQERGPFLRSPDQLWYCTEDTAVYFRLDFNPTKPETPKDTRVPEDYLDSGLSFNLNFNRPSFFGYEAMPFVEELTKRFGLLVFQRITRWPNRTLGIF